MNARTAEITAQDIEFVRLAGEHYRIFAEEADRQGEHRTAGLMRKQEFYAERFLARLEAAGSTP